MRARVHGVSFMEVSIKLALTVLIGLVLFGLSNYVSYLWIEHVVNVLTFTTREGGVDTIYLFVATPKIVLYFFAGWFLFSNKSKYLWLFIALTFCLEVYFVRHVFTEHSTLQTRFWAYFSYLFSSISVLLGYWLKQKLTNNKTSPAAKRTRFQRARL